MSEKIATNPSLCWSIHRFEINAKNRDLSRETRPGQGFTKPAASPTYKGWETMNPSMKQTSNIGKIPYPGISPRNFS